MSGIQLCPHLLCDCKQSPLSLVSQYFSDIKFWNWERLEALQVGSRHLSTRSLMCGFQGVYWFPKAVVTNHHKLSGCFLTVLEAGSPSSRCQQGWFLLRPLPLACRRPLSCCPHMVIPACVGADRVPISSSCEDTSHTGLGLPP